MPNLLFGPSFLCSFDNLRIELLGTVFLNYSVRPTLSPVIAIVVAITSVCGFMFFLSSLFRVGSLFYLYGTFVLQSRVGVSFVVWLLVTICLLYSGYDWIKDSNNYHAECGSCALSVENFPVYQAAMVISLISLSNLFQYSSYTIILCLAFSSS